MGLSVPLQDLRRHFSPHEGALSLAAQRVISRGWYVLGSEVQAFEAAFAAAAQAPYCVTVANGTDALELALRALQGNPGDDVILAANAGMYSTVATLAVGATPVYAEILPDRLSLDPQAVEAALTPRTRAVIATHLYGCPAAIAALAALCTSRKVGLIEDCAEAHGAHIDGRPVGTWGDIGCFSFYPTKNLGALGDGGACLCRDAALDSRLRALRQYGWEKRYHASVPGGRNSRLDEIQAAFLLTLLPHLSAWNAARRAIAHRYNAAFTALPWRLPLVEDPGYVGHLYVVQVPHREKLRAQLRDLSIATDVHFPLPDYAQPALAGRVPTRSLPLTEYACDHVLTLPCFPCMTDAEIETVTQAVLATQP